MVVSQNSLEARIAELERRLSAVEESLSGAAAPPRPKAQSIREFLISKKASTAGTKALVIAYYLEKFESKSPIDLGDLTRGFANAKEPLPANPSDLLYQNVRKGLLMESPDQREGGKSWIVTNSGERIVEEELGRS